MRETRLPKIVLFCTIASGLLVTSAVAAEKQDGFVSCSIQRFKCNAGTAVSYTNDPNLKGISEKTAAIPNAAVSAKITSVPFDFAEKQAGYVVQPFELPPPGRATGFRSAEFYIKAPAGSSVIENGRVQFTFQFPGNQSPRVVTVPFSDMSPKPENSEYKTLTAGSGSFKGLDVKAANLVKAVIFVRQNIAETDAILGGFSITSGQGSFKPTTLKFSNAGCEATAL